MQRRIRWAAGVLAALGVSAALYGCSYGNTRTLLKSDMAAKELVEGRLAKAKSLDDAAAEMRDLGFVVQPRRQASVTGVGEPYLACNYLLSGPGGNTTCNVDVDVALDESGKPIVMRLERQVKPL
ncbi:MAG TPA: hypothetical protein VGE52_09375 [Pirellulales bacterium]